MLTSLEIRHIGFLKVHKAGGSTIQNILFRFGLSRDLSTVIPQTKYKLSDYGKRPNPLLEKHRKHFDILAIHSVYDEFVFASLLPDDTVNIAIVRDPLELMISGAYYYRDVEDMPYLKKVPREKFIRNLIEYPELYDERVLSWTRNSMAMDFGFPNNLHVMDTAKVAEYLAYLNEKFSLVMVMERFEESLILLKRLLQWKLKDVLYMPINAHSHNAKDSQNLTSSLIGKFELRNFLDVEIYKNFSGIFSERVAKARDGFQDEVQHFKNVLTKVWDFCCSREKVIGAEYYVKGSAWSEPFIVNSNECEYMFVQELEFIDLIRKKVLTGSKIVTKSSDTRKARVCNGLNA